MKYAVILNTTTNVLEFKSTKGFYNKNCQDLVKAGYTLFPINVENETSIQEALAKLPDNSIGFLWNRMHGAPKSMEASESFNITSSNIFTVFRDLPKKLISNATIHLDSCSTASLKEDFYNNIQFTFAKLTLHMPHVEIVGPEQNCHIDWFDMDENEHFSFYMLANPKSNYNMAIKLGEKTKSLLRENQEKPLDSIKEILLESLVKANLCGPFYTQFVGRLSTIVEDTRNDLRLATIVCIKEVTEKDCLKYVQDLIEKYHVSLSEPDPHTYPFFWDHATILSTAICANKPSVVSYLLSKGADPHKDMFRDETLYEFVKKASENPSEYGQHYKKMLRLIDREKDNIYLIFCKILQVETSEEKSRLTNIADILSLQIKKILTDSDFQGIESIEKAINLVIKTIPNNWSSAKALCMSKESELSEEIIAQIQRDRENSNNFSKLSSDKMGPPLNFSSQAQTLSHTPNEENLTICTQFTLLEQIIEIKGLNEIFNDPELETALLKETGASNITPLSKKQEGSIANDLVLTFPSKEAKIAFNKRLEKLSNSPHKPKP